MKTIYVGNLSFETGEQELETAFSAFGTIRSVSVIRDRQTSRSRGFGFVEMENDEEATAAINKLNGSDINGRTISVSEAKPRAERPKGGGGGGKGGRGGRGGRGGGGGGGSKDGDSERW